MEVGFMEQGHDLVIDSNFIENHGLVLLGVFIFNTSEKIKLAINHISTNTKFLILGISRYMIHVS